VANAPKAMVKQPPKRLRWSELLPVSTHYFYLNPTGKTISSARFYEWITKNDAKWRK
jgi:hypothetical protein